MKAVLKYNRDNKEIEIKLIKSAPNQIKPIPIIHELSKHWQKKGYKEIIDVGCGKLRNSLALVKYFSLWICDFPEQFNSQSVIERLNKLKSHKNFRGIIYASDLKKGKLKGDAAFISFVLNTIPEEKLRTNLLRDTKKNLKPPYEIFVAVPYGENYYRKRTQQENLFNDGILLNTAGSQCTFYREYTSAEIDNFLKELGFKVDKVFGADKKRLRCYLI